MPAPKATTIAIQETPASSARRLTKIVAYGEGGFGVVVPYHRAHEGFLGKVPVDYNRSGLSVFATDIIGFTADDRVKLSYHPDGFAQFSGEKPGRIVSGRDPQTGDAKGVGLMTQPLSNPIRTGPSFGITAWGLDHFDEVGSRTSVEIFTEDDFYFRLCTPETANGWMLEAFVLPTRHWAAVRKRDGAYRVAMAFKAFEATQSVLEFRVIQLPGQEVFLAVAVSHLHVSFPSPSGFVLNGPGQRRADGTGHVLMAFYPRESLETEGITIPKLDRDPKPGQDR